ncbi:MAG: tRNA lysidine(34) synthetase TilS [Gammaproteobacteria bacterium]|nr:tRNA lysidine(34) synthetase TilS [Gammaproteobacteria bacterium]
MTFSPQHIHDFLVSHVSMRRFIVAFSGGLDSTVLLHAMNNLRETHEFDLHAVHVNHGLHEDARQWAMHCKTICDAWKIPIQIREVTVKVEKGSSPEAVAREARYTCFRELLEREVMMLTAQHQDDQLETFLLQALRGGGLAGLAAMPAMAPLGQGMLGRPLLNVTREELAVYAEMEGLNWLDDPSNLNLAFDRNYLRHRVLPVLRERWPSAGATISRAAKHCADGVELLEQLASSDLQQFAAAEGGNTLPVDIFQQLPRSRAVNLLRHWLRRLDLPLPSDTKAAHIFTDLLNAREERSPCISWPGAEIRRYRNRLYAGEPLSAAPEGAYSWSLNGPLVLPAGLGELHAVPTTGRGLSRDKVAGETQVRFRDGGESLQPTGGRPTRSLKKLFQEAGIAPWLRSRIPLVFIDDKLAAVADLWTVEEFAAGPDDPGLLINWSNKPF